MLNYFVYVKMSYGFIVGNETIKNLLKEIVNNNFTYHGFVTSTPDSYQLWISVCLQGTSPQVKLTILQPSNGDDKVIATATAYCCIPLDQVIIEHGGNSNFSKTLTNISCVLLRRLQLPMIMRKPDVSPVVISNPSETLTHEQDMYHAIGWLDTQLTEYPILTNSVSKKSKPRMLQKPGYRLLQSLKRKNGSFFSMMNKCPIKQSVSILLLEAIAILSLDVRADGDFRMLEDDEIQKMRSNEMLKWTKFYYKLQDNIDAYIYCHIEMDNLDFNIYFAHVPQTSNIDLDIKKCIVRTVSSETPMVKAAASGRKIDEIPNYVSRRIQMLFQQTLHLDECTVCEFFQISTELLYYVSKIDLTTIPKYKRDNGSYAEVFDLLQNYLFLKFCEKTSNLAWVYRFKNMVKIQKISPSFWAIVPFLTDII